jgi:hypothetical protein
VPVLLLWNEETKIYLNVETYLQTRVKKYIIDIEKRNTKKKKFHFRPSWFGNKTSESKINCSGNLNEIASTREFDATKTCLVQEESGSEIAN